jgi:hypothetical protein
MTKITKEQHFKMIREMQETLLDIDYWRAKISDDVSELMFNLKRKNNQSKDSVQISEQPKWIPPILGIDDTLSIVHKSYEASLKLYKTILTAKQQNEHQEDVKKKELKEYQRIKEKYNL